jgi:hypothetical protein
MAYDTVADSVASCAGQATEMVQWGRAGQEVDTDAWWTTSHYILGAHVVPAAKVEVLEVLEERPLPGCAGDVADCVDHAMAEPLLQQTSPAGYTRDCHTRTAPGCVSLFLHPGQSGWWGTEVTWVCQSVGGTSSRRAQILAATSRGLIP